MAALSCDTESAFGGIVAFNREVGEDLAKEVVNLFAEVVLAPSISKKAKEVFETKQNLRVLELANFSNKQESNLDFWDEECEELPTNSHCKVSDE